MTDDTLKIKPCLDVGELSGAQPTPKSHGKPGQTGRFPSFDNGKIGERSVRPVF
jgi:hypothetical protein